MNVQTSQSLDPVIAYACEQWSSLSAQYGHRWKSLAAAATVYIGTWDATTQQGLSSRLAEQLNASAPKPDSYWLEIGPDRVIISGQSPRSTLYGVYDAFRRYAGVHWIYPGEAAALGAPLDSSAPSGELIEPWFERRGFVIENLYDPEYIANMIDWAAKNRVNEMFFTFSLWDRIKEEAAPELAKRGIGLTLGGHSMKFFLDRQESDSRQAADNPYTAKKQLDYTDLSWQEAVVEQIAAYCESTPALSRVSLWPEDLPADQSNNEFLPLYIRFSELLKERLQLKLPHVEVEHIAYNAGLAWNMLERGEVPASGRVDTLLAYWGRDYRYPYGLSAATDRRAEQAIQDWVQATKQQQRQLTLFEYYSDHFMFSQLFPSIPERIVEDAAYYRSLGVAGITNLIVPCTTHPGYDWKWAAGFNSYVFSRAVWGDSLAHILTDYYSYYPDHTRDAVRSWMEAVEQHVAVVTAWNFPLFPGRIVDLKRVGDHPEHRDEIAALLQNMRDHLSRLYESAPAAAVAADSPAGAYVRHLIELADTCLQAWQDR